jgi:hypothetical protein
MFRPRHAFHFFTLSRSLLARFVTDCVVRLRAPARCHWLVTCGMVAFQQEARVKAKRDALRIVDDVQPGDGRRRRGRRPDSVIAAPGAIMSERETFLGDGLCRGAQLHEKGFKIGEEFSFPFWRCGFMSRSLASTHEPTGIQLDLRVVYRPSDDRRSAQNETNS